MAEWLTAWPLLWVAKGVSKTLGLYSLRRRRLISIGVPIINLRRSSDRLRFIMWIPIPVRRVFLVNRGPEIIGMILCSSLWSNSLITGPFTGMGISMFEIKRSRDRLIVNIRIHILVRRHLNIETAPLSLPCSQCKETCFHVSPIPNKIQRVTIIRCRTKFNWLL